MKLLLVDHIMIITHGNMLYDKGQHSKQNTDGNLNYNGILGIISKLGVKSSKSLKKIIEKSPKKIIRYFMNIRHTKVSFSKFRC